MTLWPLTKRHSFDSKHASRVIESTQSVIAPPLHTPEMNAFLRRHDG